MTQNHFSCKNCTQKSQIRFKNNVIFCFGLIKKTYKPVDFYRFCICKNKKTSKNDLMEEEVQAMIQGLSTILLERSVQKINKNANQKNRN